MYITSKNLKLVIGATYLIALFTVLYFVFSFIDVKDLKNYEFIRSYKESIELTPEEKSHFNFYLKVSAIRFFLTRIYDLNFNLEGDVKHKNPLEFFEIFKFHEKNNLQDFF